LALIEKLDAAIFNDFGYARRGNGAAAMATARPARTSITWQRTAMTEPVLQRELAHEYSLALYGAPRAFNAHAARLVWPSLLGAKAREAQLPESITNDTPQCQCRTHGARATRKLTTLHHPTVYLYTRYTRRATERTSKARLSEPAKGKGQNATIDASVRELAGVSRLGIVKKNRNK